MITKKTKNYTGQAKHINSGFTLVEVIIVMVLIGVLSTIGYPTLSKWMPNYRLKAATRELHANFQKAKLHAVTKNNDVTFTFSVDAACNSTSSYSFTDAEGAQVASGIMESGVCLYFEDFDDGVSGFNSRGLPTGAVGTVKLSHAKLTKEYEITQSLAGSVRIK